MDLGLWIPFHICAFFSKSLCELCDQTVDRQVTLIDLRNSLLCPGCRSILHVIYGKRYCLLSELFANSALWKDSPFSIKWSKTRSGFEAAIDLEEERVGALSLISKSRVSETLPVGHTDQGTQLEDEHITSGWLQSSVSTPQLIRFWLSLCQNRHPECSRTRNVSEKSTSMLVIDVHRMCLVSAPISCEYVALSYVHGNIESIETRLNNLDMLCQTGSLHKMAKKLPSSIRDSILLVQRLGLDYLWIDRLCIVQDDPIARQEQMNKMNEIYGNAVLTIVHLSGESIESALPRLHSPSSTARSEQVYSDKYSEVHCFYPPTLGEKTGAKYESRAWTFQERILSNRCVFFTKYQLYFHCRRAWFTEGDPFRHHPIIANNSFLANPLDLIGHMTSSNLNFTLYSEQSGYDDTAWRRTLLQVFKKSVMTYRCRELSRSEDALNGFSGITGHLSREYDLHFVSGMPLEYIDDAMIWVSPGRLRQRLPAAARRGAPLEYFPTWSWVCLEGPITFLASDRCGDVRSSRLKSGMVEHDGKLHPISSEHVDLELFKVAEPSGWGSSQPETPVTNILHFMTESLDIETFPFGESLQGDSDRTPVCNHTQLLDSSGKQIGILYDNMVDLITPIRAQTPFLDGFTVRKRKYILLSERSMPAARVIPQSEIHRLGPKPVPEVAPMAWEKEMQIVADSVVQGRNSDFGGVVDVMLVESRGDFSIRVSVGHIWYYAWAHARSLLEDAHDEYIQLV